MSTRTRILTGIVLAASTVVCAGGASAREVRLERAGQISKLPGLHGVLRYPQSVRIGRNGDRYLLDSGNRRVVVLSQSGSVRASWSVGKVIAQRRNVSASQYDCPIELALDQAGNVYVADCPSNQIKKYSPRGKLLLSFGNEKETPYPAGVAVAGNGNVVVASSESHAVAVYAADGKLLRRFGHEGTKPGDLRYPHGVDLDSQGNIYVADYLNDRIERYSSEGKFLGAFGESGHELGQFRNPTGVRIDKSNRVWVTDTENARVQVFNLDGSDPGEYKGAAGALDHPKGIDISANNTVLIANSGKHAIDVYRFRP